MFHQPLSCRSNQLSLTLPPVFTLAATLCIAQSAIANPWADAVVSYNPGANPEAFYTDDPGVVLGSPERITGENTPFGPFPSDVTMFSTPFGTDEIISIGAGGELIVRFDHPIQDDPGHLYGIDLIVFGNTFFGLDFGAFTIAGHNAEPALIEISADGSDWRALSPGADTLFPTQGFLDAEIFGTDENFNPSGTIPTNFLKPMNPALGISDFLGLDYAQALALYDGSGGGTPLDIAPTGLTQASFVRITLPSDATISAEIDAFAVVPEPASAMILMLICTAALPRRSR